VSLTTKGRLVLGLMGTLERLHLAPSLEKVIASPMEKRLASAPSKGMLGTVVDVPIEDHQVRMRDGVEIRVRVYRPAGATVPVLYAHGGGFCAGGIMACDHICRRLAVESGAVIASVEYRLAPEHPFPGPLNDVVDSLEWFQSEELDWDRLVVAGDSAGGNLAAALALVLRDRGTPLAGQLLVYPILDLTISGAGALGYRGPGMKAKDGRVCADAYLQGHDPRDPLASPLHAPDLSGAAPALVITVEHDALREEGGLYAERLRKADVPVTLVDVAGHVHASLSLPVLYRGIDELYARMTSFVQRPGLVQP
jgi:acetyl esterase